ncbi:MAG: ABC transporter ATP-binding protein [Crocinitomicaceae bacterium]|nr:ABC transporter ATP-binding protein [Crocinitomicaceae bacterium]
MIDFKEIEIGYNKTLFRVSDLKINKGEIFVLAGKNGIGKSTLLKTISGQIKPLKGKLIINDKSINRYNLKNMSQTCAIVNSSFSGIPYLTAKNYVSLGRTPHTNAWGQLNKKDEQAAVNCLKDISMLSFQDIFTNELSDGERQLLSIARAVCQDTPIILLDEPTAFLDYKNKQKIIQYLKSIAELKKKTILISSHDLDICTQEKLPFLVISKKEKKLKKLEKTDLKTILKEAFN